MERSLGSAHSSGLVILALEESSSESAVIVGAIVLFLGLLMLVKRKNLIDFHFFAQRPFSDADQSQSIAKFKVIGAALLLILVGILFLLSGVAPL